MHTAQNLTEEKLRQLYVMFCFGLLNLPESHLVLAFDLSSISGVLSTLSLPARCLESECASLEQSMSYLGNTSPSQFILFAMVISEVKAAACILHTCVVGLCAVSPLPAQHNWAVLSAAHLWVHLHVNIKYVVQMMLITNIVQCSFGLSVSRLQHWFVLSDG